MQNLPNFHLQFSRCIKITLALLLFIPLAFAQSPNFEIPSPLVLPDSSGRSSTISTAGSIDLSNPFFKSLGSNGRSCASCHQPSQGWSISPENVQLRFLMTFGTDPVFRPVDGATCPSDDVSTYRARASAYSLLLKKALIRISIAVPSNAEFSIIGISDPYNCAETTVNQPAMYRRPLPSTNLRFLSAVMWDGRETASGQTIVTDLASQATDATNGHAQAQTPPAPEDVQQIVNFETGLFTAQESDRRAGNLSAQGASGGPAPLIAQPFFLGINDPLGMNPTGAAFDPNAFTIYQSWQNLPGHDSKEEARRSISRGEALFNTFPIVITGVAGLNTLPGLATVQGSCSTCHNSPNVGDHSLSVPLNIGISDFPGRPGLDISGLPVYTVQCNATNPPTFVQVTDLGRAMISGKCADIGKMKGPVLRGLAARAPYFHNGSARSLLDVVNFYDKRFNLHFTPAQKADLVAFLNTL